MYQQYFGFNKPPFSIAPDPRNLYMSQQHREALAHLLFGATAGGGFVLLTGEIGTGKTTLCRCLIEQLPPSCDVALIFNPKLTALELLLTLCDELRIELSGAQMSTKTLVDRINAHLLNTHANGRNTLLIIDEAQNLSADVLEQMRLLTNLETTERKLLQIILLGQPELRQKLAQPELAQLAQRIVARFHLGPLAKRDLAGYISHRISTAGSQRQIIPPNLLPTIYRASRGVPRVVNLLCDRALLGAYVEGKNQVDRKVLAKALREVRGDAEARFPSVSARWALSAVGLACVGVVAAFAIRSTLFGEYSDRAAPASVGFDVSRLPTASSYREGAKTPNALAAVTAGAGLPTTAASLAARADENASMTSGAINTVGAELVGKAAAKTVAGATPAGPVGIGRTRNETAAWKALFDRWGMSYRADNPLAPCEQALAAGLSCLTANGTLQDLKVLDQPALLQLKSGKGSSRYATLSALNGATATLVTEEGVTTRGIGEVEDEWTGNYTVLWQVPPAYTGVMEHGDRGDAVLWLRRQLVQLDRLPLTSQSKPVFDYKLMQQLEKFQKDQGMLADGRLGPQTVIRLMAALDSRIPQLASSKKDN
jgi:general secretion pathway protein A